MSDEFISPSDLAVIQQARLRADLAMKEVENVQLKAFIRYGLKGDDSFDVATGKIIRAPQATPDTSGPSGS